MNANERRQLSAAVLWEALLVESAPSADVCRRRDSFHMYAMSTDNSQQKCFKASVDYIHAHLKKEKEIIIKNKTELFTLRVCNTK